MSNRTIELNDKLYSYLLTHSVCETKAQRQLRERTANLDMAVMQISPEQGQFMSLLVNLTGASRILEIGVFTGYSTLCMAQALSDEGKIVACDINREWTDIAQVYWQQAGVNNFIDLHLGDARNTLTQLVAEKNESSFDLAFIDADKQNYDFYYESCLKLVRQGGLILIDNVLWGGSVADSSVQDVETCAIRDLNDKLYTDTRVEISMLPVGDGLTLARVK